ncbi:MAG: hypothetical protein HY421_00785 [Candidatus Kerfeldbacteria bacterium]|nr:hypothetical protein [Candidatus Kerfeldbacteria bacterium]
MHDHRRHDSKMMWVMLLACALPLLLVSLAGTNRSPVLWFTVGLGGMLLLHGTIMRSMHRSSQNKKHGIHHDQTEQQKPTGANHHSSHS